GAAMVNKGLALKYGYATSYQQAAGEGAGGLPAKLASQANQNQLDINKERTLAPIHVIENLTRQAGRPVEIAPGRWVSAASLLEPNVSGAINSMVSGLPGASSGQPAAQSAPTPQQAPSGFKYYNPNDPLNGPALQTVPAQFRPMVQNLAKREDVPLPAWVALVQRESGWNPNVPTGAAGDTGLGQVLPGTGRDMLSGDYNLKDPYTNLTASSRYLHRQLNASGGDVPSGLMGYNTGSVTKPNIGYIQPIATTMQGWAQQTGGAQPVAPGPRAQPIPLATSPQAQQEAAPQQPGSFVPTQPAMPTVLKATVAPPDLSPTP